MGHTIAADSHLTDLEAYRKNSVPTTPVVDLVGRNQCTVSFSHGETQLQLNASRT
jgi:hypothetical protein